MYSVFTFSEPGGHSVNEDAFAAQQHPADAACWVCVLADGQGGQPGGTRAAQLACQVVLDQALTLPVIALGKPGTWLSLLRGADEAVRADGQAGYCTLVGFALAGDTLLGASSGDSAAWLVAHGRVQDLTAAQVKDPPVWSGAAVLVPFAEKLREPWQVLAMSDGVWKYVGRDRAEDLARTLQGQALVDGLQQQARLPGSGRFQDDFTVIVILSQA